MLLSMLLLLLSIGLSGAAPGKILAMRQMTVALPNPILFVTQVPVPADYITIGAVFGNQQGAVDKAARGGDLWIRYPDGTLKNLTQAGGYGTAGFQGANSIAVRDPSVHWDGNKAVLAMVVGSPVQQYQGSTYYWQLYEISGLGLADTPVITKVANQPVNANNVAPMYGTDDRIIFSSDRPRNGAANLYPQLDEYEEAPTPTGLWSLDPASGDLFMLNHAPSGAFTPILDSFGRVIFTRWDHLQRDQQADGDTLGTTNYGTFNYSDESATSIRLNSRAEVFPEPRSARTDLLAGTNLVGNNFNSFSPWSIDEDGTQEETLNHVGRHELQGYFARSLNDDSNLVDFAPPSAAERANRNSINNFLQIKESPTQPGLYFGIDAPEFQTHAAGQIISLTGAPSLNGDQMVVTFVTDRSTSTYGNPGPNQTGHYREPLPLSDGTLVAVHTPQVNADSNAGTRANPQSLYDFRLKTIKQSGATWAADQPLTAGISKSISYYDPDVLVTYTGNLWELNPVEVRARTRPARITPALPQPEQQALAKAGVNLAALQSYLKQNDLAIVVSRNVTTRDDADRQQPFNLHVAGSSTQTTGANGKVYDVAFLQFFQADQLRGLSFGNPSPAPGRRVLAEPMHEPSVKNPPVAGPAGSVALGTDGSMAAFVPARRALTWQLTDSAGTGVVRERYWLTFQPGEIRVCTSCHGLNSEDQAGHAIPTNQPQALEELAQYWNNRAPAGSGPLYLPELTKMAP